MEAAGVEPAGVTARILSPPPNTQHHLVRDWLLARPCFATLPCAGDFTRPQVDIQRLCLALSAKSLPGEFRALTSCSAYRWRILLSACRLFLQHIWKRQDLNLRSATLLSVRWSIRNPLAWQPCQVRVARLAVCCPLHHAPMCRPSTGSAACAWFPPQLARDFATTTHPGPVLHPVGFRCCPLSTRHLHDGTTAILRFLCHSTLDGAQLRKTGR